MSYCINPECPSRQNPNTVEECQTCGTTLVLQGRYRVLKPLMSIDPRRACDLYEVSDRGEQRVLKILKWQDAKYVELFEREAITLQDLEHPRIPKGYGLFKILTAQNDELRGFVMDKIPGQNLEAWIRNNPRPTERFVVRCLRQLVQILDYLHRSGYIHRDIKPANIMVTPDNGVFLIDFGSVQLIGHSRTRIISDGYTAPEQINSEAGPESDVYALGRTMIHLMVGIHPTLIKGDESGYLFWQGYTEGFSIPIKNIIAELVNQSVQIRKMALPKITQKLRPKFLFINQLLSRLKVIFFYSIFPYIILVVALLIIDIGFNTFVWKSNPTLEDIESGRSEDLRDEGVMREVRNGLEARVRLNKYFFWRSSIAPNDLGIVCGILNDLECTLENYRRSIDIKSKQSTEAISRYQIGVLHERLGHFEYALSEYQSAISIIEMIDTSPPAYPVIINRYSRLALWFKKDFEEAIGKSEIVLALDKVASPDISIALKNVGWAFLEQGELDRAQEYLLKSIEIDDSDATPYCLLAQVSVGRGDVESQQWWQDCKSKPNEYNLPETRTWQQQATRYLRLKGS